MIFRAKVRPDGDHNAQEILLAFFKEFNPKNSIKIEGGEVQTQIIFDEPPMEIIGAICKHKDIEFEYSQNLTESAEAEEVTLVGPEPAEGKEVTLEGPEHAETEEVILEETEPAEVDEVIPEQSELAEKQESIEKHARNKGVARAKKVSKEDEIPKLAEIAKKSSSYDEFVKAVIAWLGFRKRKEFFEQMVEAATQVDKITWENIKEFLQSKGVAVSEYYKVQISKHITTKLENAVTMLKLIRAIVAYKAFDFQGELAKGSVAESNKATPEELPMKAEPITSKQTVKMECMPEIPSFEEALGNVDKTQPIEERVRYVLMEMGIANQEPSIQQRIFEIANNAVRTENVEDTIFAETEDTEMVARLTFSTFLNDFVMQHDSTKKVKVFDFLKELQRIVT